MIKKPIATSDHPNSSTKTLVMKGFSFFFLILALVGGFLFFREYQSYQEGKNAYASIAKTVILQSAQGENNKPAGNLSPDQLDYYRIRNLIKIDFDRLIGINPDAVGWIFSENTRINYPLVQGRDNAYYSSHLASNEVNRLGSIFVDYRNKRDFSDEQTFIFGHKMNDGSMFNDMERYKESNYYNDHRSIYLLTNDQYYRVDIFAGYAMAPQNIDQIFSNFNSQNTREKYISEARQLSNFQSDVTISEEDKIVSFFTYDSATEESSFVVIGKLVPLNP